MSPGTRKRAALRADRRHRATGSSTIRRYGGSTFAEHPELAAPDARIIWHADLDPGALRVIAVHAAVNAPDSLDPAMLARWLTVATDAEGRDHAVLSDGWHHIRLDLESGHLIAGVPVLLHYHLHGLRSAAPHILPLRQFLHLCQHRRFAASLFPADTQVPRGLLLLRVHDALADGASQRDIARVLFDKVQVNRDCGAVSDSIRSRVRRLIVDARAMAKGGYRALMRRSR